MDESYGRQLEQLSLRQGFGDCFFRFNAQGLPGASPISLRKNLVELCITAEARRIHGLGNRLLVKLFELSIGLQNARMNQDWESMPVMISICKI